MEKKEKKVGSDGRFMYEYITFVPSKTNKPSFLFVQYLGSLRRPREYRYIEDKYHRSCQRK
jgi:hypothetical protein